MDNFLTPQIILSLVTATASGFVGYFFYRLKKYEQEKIREMRELVKRDSAVNGALRALCRDRILQGYRFYKQHGEISTQDFETMDKLYRAYHDLGGNGTITAVYEKILQLPIKEGV
jgi:hypothetical protein